MRCDPMPMRPHTTVVLAMSADGKIADAWRSAARFGSATDKRHLEAQIAQVDGVLFGAETLRAYGTTLRVSHPDLLQQRQQQGKPPQPTHIVCSRSAQLNPDFPFFQQAVPRWLITTTAGAKLWSNRSEFDRILAPFSTNEQPNWAQILEQLTELDLKTLAILGGGQLIASMLAAGCIDELWLTVCPLLLGGTTAPTPVAGDGFPVQYAPRLTLLSAQTIGQEVLLHYAVKQAS
jgi:5-amino-6-(5-phosphoribosylamino)uracil reductase